MLIMFRKVILFAAIAMVIVNICLTVQAQSNSWILEGRFVNYTSFPYARSETFAFQANSFSIFSGVALTILP